MLYRSSNSEESSLDIIYSLTASSSEKSEVKVFKLYNLIPALPVVSPTFTVCWPVNDSEFWYTADADIIPLMNIIIKLWYVSEVLVIMNITWLRSSAAYIILQVVPAGEVIFIIWPVITHPTLVSVFTHENIIALSSITLVAMKSTSIAIPVALISELNGFTLTSILEPLDITNEVPSHPDCGVHWKLLKLVE